MAKVNTWRHIAWLVVIGFPWVVTAAEPLHPVPIAPALTWDGPQFVDSDANGRVYLLRARDLLVIPVDGTRGLGEPRQLFESHLEGGPPVTRGAMEDEADWIVRQGYEVRWFRHGEERPVPPPRWPVWSIAMLKGNPIAAVVPAPMGPAPPGASESHPILIGLVGDRWDPIVEIDPEDAERPRTELMQRHASRIMTDSSGTIWMGQEYGYEVRRFAANGRELMRLTVDGGEIRHRDELDGAVAARLEASRKNLPSSDSSRVVRNTAIGVVAALAEGRDGRYYFLIHDSEKEQLALDRWDPGDLRLERVALKIEDPGGMSMAPGKDGLYIAAFSGKRGRWFLPWEVIEGASWEAVSGVALDGWIAPPEDGEERRDDPAGIPPPTAPADAAGSSPAEGRL